MEPDSFTLSFLNYNLQLHKLLFYYNILFIFIFIIIIEYFNIKSNCQVYVDKKDRIKQIFLIQAFLLVKRTKWQNGTFNQADVLCW